MYARSIACLVCGGRSLPGGAVVKKIKIKGVLIMVLMSLLPEYVVLVNYARKFMQHDRRLL